MSDPRKRMHLSPDQWIYRDPADADDDDGAIVDDDMGTQYDTADYGGSDDGNTVYSDADPGL